MKARIPQGMGGGPQNMQAMLRQAQKMQEDMANLQADLDSREYEIKAGGGVVALKITGQKQITELVIDNDIIDPDDPETLADVLTAAFNEAIRTVEETNKTEVEKITGSINMPGLF